MPAVTDVGLTRQGIHEARIIRDAEVAAKPSVEARIRELRADGMGILKIGRTVGVGTSVVRRVVGVGL